MQHREIEQTQRVHPSRLRKRPEGFYGTFRYHKGSNRVACETFAIDLKGLKTPKNGPAALLRAERQALTDRRLHVHDGFAHTNVSTHLRANFQARNPFYVGLRLAFA